MREKDTSNLPQRTVFCDFDGTITAVETFAGMLKEFAPELSAELMPKMYNRSLTLREGVKQLLESIPSSLYSDMIAFAEDKPLRPGLDELLDFLEAHSVPFVVISGGLHDMVEQVLSRKVEGKTPIIHRVKSIAAVKLDPSGDYLRVSSDFEADTELVAKVRVMEQFPSQETIAIGDSLTDINMARKADVVFARDRLIDYLKEENISYIEWENFYDVRDHLASRFSKQ